MNKIEKAIATIEGLSIKEAGGHAVLLRDAAEVLRGILAARSQPAKIDWTKVAHPEVLACLREGRKINAIKLQRELTSMGLAEAKGFVEQNPECENAARAYDDTRLRP